MIARGQLEGVGPLLAGARYLGRGRVAGLAMIWGTI
jgi:hypothetical protein